MRWSHALAPPNSKVPLKTAAAYAEQLRAMHLGVRTKKKQRQGCWKKPFPMGNIGSDVRWMKDALDTKMANGVGVHYCPNCGFELDRVTVRR